MPSIGGNNRGLYNKPSENRNRVCPSSTCDKALTKTPWALKFALCARAYKLRRKN